MTKAVFEEYVIHTGFGDPLAKIGSGMRLVKARIGTKWVQVRTRDDYSKQRILKTKWMTIAHVRYTGQSTGAIMSELDAFVKARKRSRRRQRP